MSLENHPNFHVVKFATDISASLKECLRGGAELDDIDTKMILGFVEDVEKRIDEKVEGREGGVTHG